MIWGPKSVQNEVGNRVGKVIGKRRAKEGLIGANLGSKMGSCWAENRRRLESKKTLKREVKKEGDAPWSSKVWGVGGPP